MRTASLVVISLVCGWGVAWIFRHTVNRDALNTTRKRIYAHLLEFRLFADEPRLIFHAQLQLIIENGRLMRLVLLPALISALPLAWIWLQLDAVYGYQPLPLGRPAIVTAQLDRAIEPEDVRSTFEAPPEISVETPPVRDFTDRQISWRIRPMRPVSGVLRLTLQTDAVEKKLSAGDRTIFLLPRRGRSLVSFLLHPEEPRLNSTSVEWIEVNYPKTESWILQFLAIATASALVFGRNL